MSFFESEWAAQMRRSAQTASNRRVWIRREMIRAEEAGDVPRMRDLQARYLRETGEYFETTLAWQ